jgi:hypothetical protein
MAALGGPCDIRTPNDNQVADRKWLHENRTMRMVPHVNRLSFSAESKKKLWRPCREARALGL